MVLMAEVVVTWRFRNGHEWSKSFDNTAERDHWINTVGLVTHPDIDRIEIQENDFQLTLKDTAK